jgi:vitamin B12 transporter
MKRKLFVVTAVIISSQLPCSVFAQNPQDTTRSLDEVILTSNKYPKKQSETGKVVTVINRQQIDKSGGKSLGEVLNTVAGTTVIGANNNPGTNQTISLRGASSGNVLILIDGIPAYDPSVNTNYFDLNLISIDQIERIEILKGGQSTMYGSDAVAGVINIISRKSGAKKFSINGTMTGGGYNTLKQAVDISGRSKIVNWSAGYTHINADGFSTAHDSTGNKRFDDDGFNQHVVTARVGVKLGKNVQLNGFSTYSQYSTDLDASAFTDEKDYSVKNDNVQGGGGLVVNHGKGALHLNYNFNYVERDYFDDSVFKASPFTDWSKGRYIGRSHYAEVYNNWKLEKWEVLAGLDYRLNNTDQFYFSSGPFGPYAPLPLSVKMNQVSPYTSVIYKAKSGFTTELGGRLNIHSEYGSNFSIWKQLLLYIESFLVIQSKNKNLHQSLLCIQNTNTLPVIRSFCRQCRTGP